MMRILYPTKVDIEYLQICMIKLFWGTQETIPREKPDYLVDLEKSIKTGGLFLQEVIGHGRTFLTMKIYYSKPVSSLQYGFNF